MEQIEGLILALPVGSNNIESGAVVLVEGNGKYYRVTVSYINREGHWTVEGDYNGPIEDPAFIYRLYLNTDDRDYLINFKDYKTIIKKGMINDKKYYKFNLKPYKFKKGEHPVTCTECNSFFLASPRQPLCEKCSEKNSTVTLINPKSLKKLNVSQDTLIEIALESYTDGLENVQRDEFMDRLIDKIKNL